MSLSTLPPESAAAITAWLRNQPVCRQQLEVSNKPVTRVEAPNAAADLQRIEKFAVATPSRRSGLLLKSLQTLESQNEHRGNTAGVQHVAPPQSLSVSGCNSLGALESGQIDPLPDFDLGSLFDQDQCVFVGNRRRVETADWLPVSSTSGNKGPNSTEALVDDLSQVGRSQPAPAEGKEPTAAKSTAGSGMDRRAYPRRESDGMVSVCRRSVANRLFQQSPNLTWKLHSSTLKGRLIDVSMTGMALAMSDSLPEGTPISMQISSRSMDRTTDVTGHVLRCMPIEGPIADGEPRWRMVCQLDSRLSFEQVHSLGKQMFAYTMV